VSELLFLSLVIVGALAYDFINGFHDAANAIATSIASKALKPRTAILLATSFNFIGALVHTAVAYTIGKGVIDSSVVTSSMLFSALMGAIIWNLITWRLGLPSSSTHALVGGLIGGALVLNNFDVSILLMPGITKIILAMFAAPILAFFGGWILITLIVWPLHWLKVKKRPANRKAKKLQILSAMWMSFSHGMNDAQNAMGIITISLLTYGTIDHFHVPMVIRILCATAMGLGTMFGGWRIVKTLIKQSGENPMPIQGFSAQTSAGGVIFVMSLLGIPISTSHSISSCVMGTTAAQRVGDVNWKIGGNMVIAWIITIPAAALFSMLIQYTIQLFQ